MWPVALTGFFWNLLNTFASFFFFFFLWTEFKGFFSVEFESFLSILTQLPTI
jgi:hypothetical protein